MESTLVRFASPEWEEIKENFQISKKKCNKDLLCVPCWRVLNYEKARKHICEVPDHATKCKSSKFFASEAAFIALAKEHKKIFKSKGEVMLINPYAKEQRKRELKAEEKTADQSPRSQKEMSAELEGDSQSKLKIKENVSAAIYSLCSQVQEMEAQIEYFTREYKKTLEKIQNTNTQTTASSSQSPDSLLSKSSLASNSCSGSSEEATARFGGCLTPEEQKLGKFTEQQIDMRKVKSMGIPRIGSNQGKSKKLIKLPALKRKQRPLLLSQFQDQLFLLPQHKICTEDDPKVQDIFFPFRKEEKTEKQGEKMPSDANEQT